MRKHAEDAPCPPRTVCWNAIVRNEEKAIERCMRSLVEHIDYWVVVDTGSTDRTPSLITDFFRRRNVPGELHRQDWVDFAHNRTQALRLAEGKCDYLLLLDADMVLKVSQPDWKCRLTRDAYLIRQVMPHLEQYLPRLINAKLTGPKRWRYRGATHEFLGSEELGAGQFTAFEAISIQDFDDGGHKADKFRRDAALLEQQLAELDELEDSSWQSLTPGQRELFRDRAVLLPRTLFYLGQSYQNGRLDAERAIHFYRRRTAAGGWQEEIAYSWLQIGILLQALGRPWAESLEAFMHAIEASPQRAEALMHLARHYNASGSYALGKLFGEAAVKRCAPPATCLFVDTAVHRWAARDEYAVSLYWTGDPIEAARVWRALLADEHVPSSQHARIEENLRYADEAIAKIR